MDEEHFKKILTPKQYKVMREKGTEAPFAGKYVHENKNGIYVCSACQNQLFTSDAKFDSKTGWPSFDQAIAGSVEYKPDGNQTEIICAKCKSHLGHIFLDGPTKTGKRYCINSVCLDLKEK
ncbi:MAG: peptide-methionine (R)-S-oxide reductase MsrB [Candidatus Staskawiczbacteria bacterium]|nr:peptide-methionine (R)-S-oxide reductase MsrB [Candidatus Staskawiczbacteria bacterium]MBI3337322.1 peptide-methionine (R)-S-oxide reductase MsrB [Candidatus Staskawiczbacteria bacterium]